VLSDPSEETVSAEIDQQLGRFQSLMGRPPTHLDSHQHVHRDEPARTVLLQAGERLGVPVRWFTPGVIYSGAFYGQDGRGTPAPDAITVEALMDVIETLPIGVTELACHPAAEIDHDTAYGEERICELMTLCDPRIRAAIDGAGVDLRSFADFPREW
jgi:predicted glycoside hydrolase/deacetylase ChbG (UPF0249 family)